MSEIALYNALMKLGLDHEEAKEAVADVASSKDAAKKADIKDMATKMDIAELKAETKADIAELETRLIEKIADSKHSMIVWMIGIGLSVLIGNAMIMMTLLKLIS